MQIMVFKKRSLWQRAFRRLGAFFICLAGREQQVVIVPGTGYFVRNNKVMEVK